MFRTRGLIFKKTVVREGVAQFVYVRTVQVVVEQCVRANGIHSLVDGRVCSCERYT